MTRTELLAVSCSVASVVLVAVVVSRHGGPHPHAEAQQPDAVTTTLAPSRSAGAPTSGTLRPTPGSSTVAVHAAWAPSPDQLRRAGLAAEDMAAGDGDPTPTSAQWVATDRATYEAVIGDGSVSGAAEDGDVLVVAVHGRFTYRQMSLPGPMPVPTGSAFEFCWDATTGRVVDWGTDDPDLDAIGPPAPLALP